MALKGDRLPLEYDITLINDDVAEAGVVMCYKTAGSGVALGDSQGKCQLAADPSGLVPVGYLENDFVDIDETQFSRNEQKNQMVIGDPATIIKKGYVVTNKVIGTPTQGGTAYLIGSGNLSTGTAGAAATPKVGQFDSIKDADGYVKVSFNLPIV